MKDLILKDVSFSYPGGFLAIEHINMEIKFGENVAIVGQNGAGKTTTVKMMNGLLKPDEGEVLIGDMNTKDYTTAQVSRVVGYVFQNPDDQIFHSTVESEVRYGPKTMKLSVEEEDKRVKEALEITGMEIYKDENPMNLPLSMRKFVTIAAVIAMGTEILIFDEPTAGQDVEGNKRLSAILRTLHVQGKTVITISHDMEFVASNFEKVIVMAKRKVVRAGTPKEIFWDFESLEYAMLKQPYVSRVCRALGIKGNIIDIEGAVDYGQVKICKKTTDLSLFWHLQCIF
ncbi:ABC transporter ATP-binding protein [Muricomes intestini]|uniref:energy-coupling factor ABC transporter ATP-binding protein n=1 Tax=Muricomes intestini TaxID=1796634 RepID=UPI002FDF76C5